MEAFFQNLYSPYRCVIHEPQVKRVRNKDILINFTGTFKFEKSSSFFSRIVINNSIYRTKLNQSKSHNFVLRILVVSYFVTNYKRSSELFLFDSTSYLSWILVSEVKIFDHFVAFKNYIHDFVLIKARRNACCIFMYNLFCFVIF